MGLGFPQTLSCLDGIQQEHVQIRANLQLLAAADDTQGKDRSAVKSP